MNPARPTTAASTATAGAVVLTIAGGLLTATATAASAAPTCTAPTFTRQFYANTSFSGTPRKTDCDGAVSEDWGTRAPASGLPTNNFGVRWTVTRDFGSGGPFAWAVSAQDGIRVYLDGTRKIDLWKNTSTTTSKTLNLTIPQGKHTLRVDYVNWTGKANVKFTYTPRTTAAVDKVKPLTPTGTAATYDSSTGKAKLTWAKNQEMDLAGYRIYRRLKGASFGSAPLAPTTATSYTDATLPLTGQAYYYEVRAYDKAGNESGGTADQLVTTVDRTPPAAPTRPTVAAEMDGLRIRWSESAGAVSYRVYRAASESGTYTRVGSTAELSYVDDSAEEGRTSYYRVTALDAAGNESARSLAASGKQGDRTPPPAVTGLTVTPTQYGFKLRWDANPAADLGRYTVYKGELLGDEGDEQVCSAGLMEYLSADTTSFAYTTHPDGDEVCFFIDAIDTSWNSSFKWTGSARAVVATELDTTPSVPTPEGSPLHLDVLEAEGDEGNHLTWSGLAQDAPEQVGGYRVYRWNAGTGTYEKIAERGSGVLEYDDTGAKRGTISYYWVTAVAADGTESPPADGWAVTAPAG